MPWTFRSIQCFNDHQTINHEVSDSWNMNVLQSKPQNLPNLNRNQLQETNLHDDDLLDLINCHWSMIKFTTTGSNYHDVVVCGNSVFSFKQSHFIFIHEQTHTHRSRYLILVHHPNHLFIIIFHVGNKLLCKSSIKKRK